MWTQKEVGQAVGKRWSVGRTAVGAGPGVWGDGVGAVF